MSRCRMMKGIVFLAALVFFMAIPMLSDCAETPQKVVDIEGISYNVTVSMADNLKSLIGKVVFVTLDSGTSFTGKIKAVGKNLVHVEKLQGKEYFDALIRIDRICAIDTRFRDYQR